MMPPLWLRGCRGDCMGRGSYADSGPINPYSMMSTLHMTYGAHRGGQLRQPLVNMCHGCPDCTVNFHISLVIGAEVLRYAFYRILLRAALYLPLLAC